MLTGKSKRIAIEYGRPPSCTHDRDRSKSGYSDKKAAENQSEVVDFGYAKVLARIGAWHMLTRMEMQDILGQPIESDLVFADAIEVEQYYMEELKARLRTLAKDTAHRGLRYVEGKAIVPADVWVEAKLFFISDAGFDEFCASEEITWIF